MQLSPHSPALPQSSSPLSSPQIISSQISTQMTSKSASISSFRMLEGAKNTLPPVYPQQLPVMPLTLQPQTPPSTSLQLFSPIQLPLPHLPSAQPQSLLMTPQQPPLLQPPPQPTSTSPQVAGLFVRRHTPTPHQFPTVLDTSSQLSVSPASPPLNRHNHIKPGVGKPDRQLRKKCIVQDCTELVAPSMWRNHLNLHTQGVLPGSVPDDWLHENNMVTCSHCHHLVASTHIMSHQRKCATPRSNTNTQMDVPLFNDRIAQLPSFEKVCHCSTIHHIPAKARPAFAKTLSSTLQDILHTNNEESWLKLFLLPSVS